MNNHIVLAARELVLSRLKELPSEFILCEPAEYSWPSKNKNKKKKKKKKIVKYVLIRDESKTFEFCVHFYSTYCMLRVTKKTGVPAGTFTQNLFFQQFEYSDQNFDDDLFAAIINMEPLLI